MKRLFKWLFLLTILVAASATIILLYPQLIRSPIENYLSKVSGLDVRLDGELQLSAGKELSVKATDIHITNPAGNDLAELAVLGSLQVTFETASLFSDAIVVSHINLADAAITLITNKSGVSNWVKPAHSSAQVAADKQRKSINIKNIRVNKSSFNYQQLELGNNQVFEISSFVQAQAPDGLLNINLDATFNDRPATFVGHIGTFANIIHGRNVSFDGKGQLGPIQVNGNGVIDDLMHPKQPRFDIQLFGPDIKDVTAMLKTDDLGNGPFDLTAQGQETNGKYSALVEGKIGDVVLKVSALSQQAGKLDNLALKLNANGPNLGALARALGQKNWPDQPFNLNGEVQRSGSTLDISALKLDIGGANFVLNAKLDNFPHFDPSSMSLSVKGDDITRFRQLLGIKKGVAAGEFTLQGDLGPSGKTSRHLQASLATSVGEVQVAGVLGAPPNYSDTHLKLNLRGHNAHLFMSIFELDLLPEAPFTLVTDLHFSEANKIRHVTLNDVEVELADVKLSGEVAFDAQKPLTTASGSLLLSSPDIANFKHFHALGKTAKLFVPGQPFKLSGKLLLADQNWELNDLEGKIGGTSLSVHGVLNPSKQWSNSDLQFEVAGPGLHRLLNNIGPSSHLQEDFTSKGQLQIASNKLQLSGFEFNSGDAGATINGATAWPINADGEIQFDIVSHGEDISRFVPAIGSFKPARTAFNLKASGKQLQNLTSIDSLAGNVGSLQLTLNGDVHSATKDRVSQEQPNKEQLNKERVNREQVNRERASANIKLKSANISDLGHFDGRALPDVGLTVAANLHGNLEHFKLEQLQARLGDSDLSGTLEVLLADSKPEIILDSTLELLDISPFQPQHPPDLIAKPVNAEQRRLIPATVLPIDALGAFDATIDARIKQFKLKSDSLKNMVLKATIRDGALDVPVLTLDGRRGSAWSTLKVAPTGSGQARVTIDLQTSGFVLNTSGHPQFDADNVPTLDLALKASGQGGNWQEIASTATGTFRLGSEGGMLAGVNLGILDNFLLNQIFNLLLPKSKQGVNTKLTCAAAVFELKNGVATSHPAIAFVTDKITLVSKGSLDLGTEKLDFAFKATPNNVLNISAGELLNSFIVVSGSLGNPVVGLDPTKVLLEGGAAIGTAGISLLARGLLNRVGNMEPVCQSMLADVK